MKHICVVGLQWGDEGKGKIVDVLSEGVDGVERAEALVFEEFNGRKGPIFCSVALIRTILCSICRILFWLILLPFLFL